MAYKVFNDKWGGGVIREMNISKYDFHDGILSAISRSGDNIAIAMESSQISPEDNREEIPLTSFHTIKGKLHLEGVKSIRMNNKLVQRFEKTHDAGDIFDFDIEDNTVRLLVMWDDYPPKPRLHSDMYTYEITADKIYWENLPN